MGTRAVVRCVAAVLASLALVVGFFPSVASAAETGSIAGTVGFVEDADPAWTRVCAERTPEGDTVVCSEFPEGGYQLDGLPPGEYIVWFQAMIEEPCRTYFDEVFENDLSWGDWKTVTVTEGAVTAGIDAIISVPIYGTVSDPDGNPIAGATVAAYADTDTWLPTGVVTTQDQGYFYLSDLLAGSYRLLVVPPPGSALRSQWYGSPTGARADAPLLDVFLCKDWQNEAVTLQKAGGMSGTVSFNTGDPAGGIQVAAYRPGAWLPSATVTTAADGRYGFSGLSDGEYQVVALGPTEVVRPAVWVGGTGRATATSHAVTAGTSITGIDVTVPYGSNLPVQTLLSGTVQLEGGNPAVGATVAAYGSSNGVLPRATVAVGDDGTFAFDGLPPDIYRLLVRVPSGSGSSLTHYWHAEPGVTSRSRAAAAPFDLSAGGQVEGVTVVYPSS